jgi:hypothetical protein
MATRGGPGASRICREALSQNGDWLRAEPAKPLRAFRPGPVPVPILRKSPSWGLNFSVEKFGKLRRQKSRLQAQAAPRLSERPARTFQLSNFSQGHPRPESTLSAHTNPKRERGAASGFGAEVRQSSRPRTRPLKRKRRLAFRGGWRELGELLKFFMGHLTPFPARVGHGSRVTISSSAAALRRAEAGRRRPNQPLVEHKG